MNTGWAGKVMAFLNYATQVVILNVLWILGCLAGGILLGISPATRSLGRLSTALMLGSPSETLWKDFWSHWRANFWDTNKKSWPFLIALLVLAADLIALELLSFNKVPGAGLLIGPLVIVAAACAVAFAFFQASLLRFDDSVWATVKFAFATPVAFLPTTIAILLVNLAFLMLMWTWPIVAVLCGFSTPLGFSIAVAGRALDNSYQTGFKTQDTMLVEADSEAKIRDAKRAEENERMKRLKQ